MTQMASSMVLTEQRMELVTPKHISRFQNHPLIGQPVGARSVHVYTGSATANCATLNAFYRDRKQNAQNFLSHA